MEVWRGYLYVLKVGLKGISINPQHRNFNFIFKETLFAD